MSPKYQIVIPQAAQEPQELRQGDTPLFLVSGDSVILRNRPPSYTEAMRGLHKEIWPADTAGWLEQEWAAWE